MLRLDNIKKEYIVANQSVHALKGVSINFRKSELVSILGPSGCGKTTLLNIIGGLDKYTSGDLNINGVSTKLYKDRDWDVYRNHRVGFVFQSYNLIPHQTVLGNVELSLTIAGMDKATRREKARKALERVGLVDHINKYPNQLSGGQCQRVAIARALVNDPEILLADEPTGALDTVTSVQIMELIKEIAKDRLVVMVTHNPELAEQYSTRIIKLLDGNVIADSNPCTDAEAGDMFVCPECGAKLRLPTNANSNQKVVRCPRCKNCIEKPAKRENTKKNRAKMGFFTAFMLSLKNLLTKKKRTFMTLFAGSIGIIGVAVVLAFSSGITGYIDSMENDMMSAYPVYVSQNSIDYAAIMSLTTSMKEDAMFGDDDNILDEVYINKIVETISSISSINIKNEITAEYIDFLGKMPTNYCDTVQYNYGIDFANNIYTDFAYDVDGTIEESLSVTGIREVYANVLSKVDDYAAYSSMITSVSTFGELPDSEDYIMSQYDVVAGDYPEQSDSDSLVLVLSSNNEIDDLMLVQMGFSSQREFLNYAYSLAEAEDEEYTFYQEDVPSLSETLNYDDFVGENGKKYTWHSNDNVFKANDTSGYTYQTIENTEVDEYEKELGVTCILRPKDSVQYGALDSGMYYTKALSDYVMNIELNEDTQSAIVKEALADEDNQVGDVKFGEYYFYYDVEDKTSGEVTFDVYEQVLNTDFGTASDTGTSSDMLGSLASVMDEAAFTEYVYNFLETYFGTDAEAQLNGLVSVIVQSYYVSSDKYVFLSELGGDSIPYSIYFYTASFEKKDLVTSYLDEWNDLDNGYITSSLEEITYTDTMGVVVDMIDMFIFIVTTALVAFTSLSLVVSTVMIGIITYVSVVERIKEIGVIRSVGGRKKDVRNLFIAETLMLGLGSGLVGIGVTYLLQVIVNLTLGVMLGTAIVNLVWYQAIIMVGISTVLTLISGLMPAGSAAKKDPVIALRTE